MSSARKMKLKVQAPKPRNPLVAAAAQRKAGSHRKSASSQRQQAQRQLRRQLRDV